jgi:hypothetical protein
VRTPCAAMLARKASNGPALISGTTLACGCGASSSGEDDPFAVELGGGLLIDHTVMR